MASIRNRALMMTTTYHSDYDTYGFRKSEILPILAKHGLTLDLDQGTQASSHERGTELEQAPAWKLTLSLRTRLSVFEAVCALAGVDPFTEWETVERCGVNEAVYDMNKTLLDEVMDTGVIRTFEKTEGNETRYFVDAKDFAVWCDRLNIKRPLPWTFEKVQVTADSELRQQNEDLRRSLTEAQEKIERLDAEVIGLNDKISRDNSRLSKYEADMFRLESAIAEGQASQPAPQQAAPMPDYLDPVHPRYSYRLAAAVLAWEAVTEPGNRGVKNAIEAWLRDHAEDLKLMNRDKPSSKAIADVATVVNWNVSGGAPKTY